MIGKHAFGIGRLLHAQYVHAATVIQLIIINVIVAVVWVPSRMCGGVCWLWNVWNVDGRMSGVWNVEWAEYMLQGYVDIGPDVMPKMWKVQWMGEHCNPGLDWAFNQRVLNWNAWRWICGWNWKEWNMAGKMTAMWKLVSTYCALNINVCECGWMPATYEATRVIWTEAEHGRCVLETFQLYIYIYKWKIFKHI